MDIKRLWMVGAAAAECGIDRQRLYKAIRTGHVRCQESGCGRQFVTLADVRRYLAKPPKMGRPREN